MLKKGRATPLAHWITFSGLAALLVSLGAFMPLLGFWGMLLAPLPLALLGYRDGMRWMLPGLLLTEGLLLRTPLLALYFLLGCFPIALTLLLVSRTRWSGSESLAVCALVSLGAKLVLLAAFWALTGHNVLLPDAGQVEVLLRSFYSDLPLEEARAAQEAIRQALILFPYMMPSMVLLYSMLDSIVNYRLCCRFLRAVGGGPPALPPFSNWRLPRSLLPAMILSFLLGWLWNVDTWLQGAMFASNLRLVLNVLFFVQGLSLISWWMERRGGRPVLKFLVLGLMLFPLMWMWPILLGVGDMALDFRARAGRTK